MAILDWPGKSALIPGGPQHPAAYHMLDVAAVAERLLAPEPLAAPLKSALTVLVALHDIGKFNADFRAMIAGARPQGRRHWEVSEVLLLHNRAVLAAALRPGTAVLIPLIEAVSGHHGRPSEPGLQNDTERRKALKHAGPEAQADALAFLHAVLALWPDAALAGLTEAEARRLSWWLPGLTSAADWIGSNVDWFPPCADPLPLADYLTQARAKAMVAVQWAGLGGARASDHSFLSLPSLRPMQEACAGLPLPEGPMLAVIEDETGSGKTEAAMLLAQRMLLAGKGRGLFFALPTMATADSMFARSARHLRAMFHGAPTLTLAHGRAALSQTFRDLVQPRPNAPEDQGCTEWLAESRRRALLAEIGVGTIDQALLSALPVKWQTLRHYGLSSKILIVDEVHEMGEPYIDRILRQVLTMHRAAAGSAILMTATLPLNQRQALLDIYDHGPDPDPAYPALTIAKGARRRDLPQKTGAKGAVAVERLPDADAAIRLLTEAAAKGAACVWVRNAVDDAIAAVQALRAAGVPAALLHARYALGDRKRIEADQLGRFGPDGEGRAGRVLVGTQVLESSLNLDFDVMVSDLAPMAALIQRAGRLWRHMDRRPLATRPVPRPVLHVVSPDPAQVTTARWLHQVLDRGAWVYPQALLWRTAHHLFAAGQIVAPSGLRGLIEAAHGDIPAVPPLLERAEIEAWGQDQAKGALAWQNVVDASKTYRAEGRGDDDASYPTRLGEPQTTVVLARQGEALTPLFPDEPLALSELTLSTRRLAALPVPDQSRPDILALRATWPKWRQETVTVLPLAADGTICEGLRYDPDLGMVYPAPS
ncbi:CRISPR-associated helicase Cas3' [Rhodobacter sp. KR11]|uniref:CRISPR-associated helicase Cas3' n=1 Tax=Rhodobacter sp. KR11 TaxID=2974588 RepID=UPI0022223427|nr:CRISPR-associated helicase Cas3' [Rhodobacter sp. KR11]MCW1918120.1 CRISPR-associated helicase Cas3' [Rhodobacter sp. KR11]